MQRITQKMLESRARAVADHLGAPVIISIGSRPNGRMWRAYVKRDGSDEIARAWSRAELYEQFRAIDDAFYYVARATEEVRP